MQAYKEYLSGNLEDRNYDEQELAMVLVGLPRLQHKFAQLKKVCYLVA